MRRFIVTGAPRSATQYAAALWQALGTDCPHEMHFKPTVSMWDALQWHQKSCGESSWLAWAFLPMIDDPDVIVFHQRRDPWKVIDSLAFRNWQVIRNVDACTPNQQKFQDVTRHYCPRVWQYEEAVDRAAAMLLDWNRCIDEACERYPVIRYNVEDLDRERVAGFCDLVEHDVTRTQVDDALAEVSTSQNFGKKLERGRVSDPLVEQYIVERFGFCPNMICVGAATDFHRPEQLAGMIDPTLLQEVNEYAIEHGYEPAPSPALN